MYYLTLPYLGTSLKNTSTVLPEVGRLGKQLGTGSIFRRKVAKVSIKKERKEGRNTVKFRFSFFFPFF